MAPQGKYRNLTNLELTALEQQGCRTDGGDWTNVLVADRFDTRRVINVRFEGRVRVGALDGITMGADAKPACIENACLVGCEVGDNARIRNVGVRIANYAIGDGACIENVGTMETRPAARFGNGVEVPVLNEGGGRDVAMFDELSSQFAHMLCLHRFRPKLIGRLQQMARAAAERAQSDTGRVGEGASVVSVGEIVDVRIGPYAKVHGAASLVNGTILSHREAPTHVGSGVHATGFIIAEGAQVTGGAMLAATYVGQGSRVGRQFSAEGCLLFANCEAFHGEACSVFAGPFTVTHHKSTLLIAGMFSFYNAGSGTNQSNHMYKLGPVHEGRLERGSKTGSFSYMMWPCRVGPFSVVLGKHTRTFDSADLPFSHIEAMPDGRCSLVPGFNLSTVGTVRDGAKWPTRDRRKGPVRRDHLSFDVFSPYTAGRMLRGMALLKKFQEQTDRSVAAVAIGGAEVKRVFLRTGQKYYRRATLMYLTEKIVARVQAAIVNGARSIAEAVRSDDGAVYSETWVDVGGQMMASARLQQLVDRVEQETVADINALDAELDRIDKAYRADEWVWVKQAYHELTGTDLDAADVDAIAAAADTLLATRREFLEAVLVDAVKEFDSLSRVGFGTDGGDEDADADFQAVRGNYDANAFVVQMRDEIQSLSTRVAAFKEMLGRAIEARGER